MRHERVTYDAQKGDMGDTLTMYQGHYERRLVATLDVVRKSFSKLIPIRASVMTKPSYQITVQASDDATDQDAIRCLRWLLKRLGRTCCLRAVTVERVNADSKQF